MDIAALIARERERQQLSQAELADLAKTSQGQISRIERGEISPSFSMIEKIFAAMGEDIIIELKKKPVPPRKGKELDLLFNPPMLRKKS